MFTEIRLALRPAISLLLVFTVLTGLAYPLVVTGLAQVLMPSQANGSLITRDNSVIGSALIGQKFSSAGYFQGRPSASGKDGYDASASSGSNLSPASADLRERIKTDVAAQRAQGVTGAVPADLVTTSASGLDPDLSPAAALVQVPRVAKARGIDEQVLRELIARLQSGAVQGFLGDPRVNVLQLNLAIDQMSATPAP